MIDALEAKLIAMDFLESVVKNEKDENMEEIKGRCIEGLNETEQGMVFFAAKCLIAKAISRECIPMTGKCYQCTYRKNIPGSSYSCCTNKNAAAIGDKYGTGRGWFKHPDAFDPVWLLYCDEYTPTKEVEREPKRKDARKHARK